jgi:hypothetical protein
MSDHRRLPSALVRSCFIVRKTRPPPRRSDRRHRRLARGRASQRRTWPLPSNLPSDPAGFVDSTATSDDNSSDSIELTEDVSEKNDKTLTLYKWADPGPRTRTLDAAHALWPDILTSFGIPPSALDGKHHPCLWWQGSLPLHRRTRRRRLLLQRLCAGKGISLVMKVKGWDYAEAAKRVDEIIGNVKLVA